MRRAPVFLAVLALGMGPQNASPDLEREARVLETMLIAPCCFSQQVSVHESPAADEVRRDVRARLAAGETRREILNAYVARYGKRILAEPPPAGFDVTLYVVPVAVFLVTAGLGVLAVRRFARRSVDAPAQADRPPDVAAPSPTEESRLDEELRDLD